MVSIMVKQMAIQLMGGLEIAVKIKTKMFPFTIIFL